jgi:ubiquinone biosynthesis protein COQ9
MASKLRPLRPLIPRKAPRNTVCYNRTRAYHSHDHSPPPGPFNATELLILSHAAPHIPKHGFTDTTLSLGAKEAGYIDASTNLFPRGAFSLVHWHLWNKRMALKDGTVMTGLKAAAEETGKGMGVGQKVKALAWERLMANKDVVGRWQEVRFFRPVQ